MVIGIKLVLVEFPWNCYVVKLVLVEIDYVVLTSTNYAQYDFFKIPKIVLSEDPLYSQTMARPSSQVRPAATFYGKEGSISNTKVATMNEA